MKEGWTQNVIFKKKKKVKEHCCIEEHSKGDVR
jgi:hypothetical protein